MSNKNNDQFSAGSGEEFKDNNIKYVLSKFEYDLYHEEDNIAETVIRVKRTNLPNKGERWKVFQDQKAVFTVEGTKLSNKEKEFLRTPEGFSFLIKEFKIGIKSFNSLKLKLKDVLTKK